MQISPAAEMQDMIAAAELSDLEYKLVMFHFYDSPAVRKVKKCGSGGSNYQLTMKQFRIIFPVETAAFAFSKRDIDDTLCEALQAGLAKIQAVLLSHRITGVASMLDV